MHRDCNTDVSLGTVLLASRPEHTSAHPYCGDLACWCHTDVAYHRLVTLVPRPMDDQQVRALYACFGLARVVEVA